MLVNFAQQRNANSQMLVKDSGSFTLVNSVQPEKLPHSDLIELESFTLVNPVQFSKVYVTKRVTESGISMLVKPVQFSYLQPIITQYFIDNKSEIWLLFLIAHSKR